MPGSLRQSLVLSAEKYCKRALTAFVGEDDPDFFLFAGIAMEHALNAHASLAAWSIEFDSASVGWWAFVDHAVSQSDEISSHARRRTFERVPAEPGVT